ncbi:FlxA-like family protein [Shewanella sp. SR44-3]|uniref:FlxA-like family protein n=1 Tax=unclassified Shewanella TaxID=196818 RepID=UPI0015FD8114|nr:FlxA-like family protein [Shewanella sp. SR44-3]MBB1268923.1 FlxA-like family protein [Shewanella sp. SR44-3]
MEISGAKMALGSQSPLKVQVRTQGADGAPSVASVSPQSEQDKVSISQAGKNALAASTGAVLHAQGASDSGSAEEADGGKALSPVEKQIKDLEEKVKELKEQLSELKGDNSEEAVEKRKQLQQQIMIYSGMIATFTKQLEKQNAESSSKG